jgi:gluconate 2-dehydrogenase gamma chain
LLGSGWAVLRLPMVAGLAACSREAAARGEAFGTLGAAEAATLRAVAARILPSGDGLPGAEEAGAVWFMDRVLGEHLPELLAPVRAGVEDLDRRAGTGGFASVSAERQDALLTQVEATPFFSLIRTLTLAGVLGDPRYGGNRDGAGERLLQIEGHGPHLPPFGWYDARYADAAAPGAAGGAPGGGP